jgi:hypothetical protein
MKICTWEVAVIHGDGQAEKMVLKVVACNFL